MFTDGGTDKWIAARPEMFNLANTFSSGELNTIGHQIQLCI